MDRCPKCNRMLTPMKHPPSIDWCNNRGGAVCGFIEAAYKRGMIAGVRVARNHAYADKHGAVSFHDVDCVIAKLTEEKP